MYLKDFLFGKRNIDPITNAKRKTIQITVPISPGSSGSHVFNKSGKVIGVVSIGSGRLLQNLNFASLHNSVFQYYVNEGYFKFLNKGANSVYIDNLNTNFKTF